MDMDPNSIHAYTSCRWPTSHVFHMVKFSDPWALAGYGSIIDPWYYIVVNGHQSVVREMLEEVCSRAKFPVNV